MTLWKAHHGIMKSDAIADYNYVLKYCKNRNLPILIPKQWTCKEIENTTAYMINNIIDGDIIILYDK